MEFIANKEGVHALYGEYTLCGWAFDAPESERDWKHGPFEPTKRRTVTCRECARVIRACRSVRVDTSKTLSP
jgi:hypothetical protein